MKGVWINISSLRNNNVSVTNGLNQLRQVYINVTVLFQKNKNGPFKHRSKCIS